MSDKYCKAGKIECGCCFSGFSCKVPIGRMGIESLEVCPWPSKQKEIEKSKVVTTLIECPRCSNKFKLITATGVIDEGVLEQKDAKIKELQRKVAELDAAVEGKSAYINDLEKDEEIIEKQEKKIKELEGELEELYKALADTSAEIANSERKNEILTATVSEYKLNKCLKETLYTQQHTELEEYKTSIKLLTKLLNDTIKEK